MTAATDFLSQHPDTRAVDAFVIDLCGRAVGKRYPVTDLPALVADGSGLCAAMQLTDVNGISWDTAGLGFSDGDPDTPIRMVAGRLMPVPWATEPRAQALMQFTDADGAPLWHDPRKVLADVVARFAELELTTVVAVELEFYLIDRDRDADGAPQLATSPVTGRRSGSGRVFNMSLLDEFGGVIAAIEAAANLQALPVTTICREYGPGQYEFNLAHKADALSAADDAALLRHLVTEVSRARGFDATFMSKPFATESGSGLQVNLSLLDADGSNVFDPRREGGDAMLGHAVGGMQATLAEAMALFAPNIHAYRRFAPDQFTPVTRDWGDNNRSVAFRVPASSPENRRIEHRAAGAEANPYLVVAAVLAGAHHGITQRLDAGAKGTGNVGAEVDPALPLKLWDALAALEAAKVLPGYFEPRYLSAYADVKRNEFDSFMEAILPHEHEWYL